MKREAASGRSRDGLVTTLNAGHQSASPDLQLGRSSWLTLFSGFSLWEALSVPSGCALWAACWRGVLAHLCEPASSSFPQTHTHTHARRAIPKPCPVIPESTFCDVPHQTSGRGALCRDVDREDVSSSPCGFSWLLEDVRFPRDQGTVPLCTIPGDSLNLCSFGQTPGYLFSS